MTSTSARLAESVQRCCGRASHLSASRNITVRRALTLLPDSSANRQNSRICKYDRRTSRKLEDDCVAGRISSVRRCSAKTKMIAGGRSWPSSSQSNFIIACLGVKAIKVKDVVLMGDQPSYSVRACFAVIVWSRWSSVTLLKRLPYVSVCRDMGNFRSLSGWHKRHAWLPSHPNSLSLMPQ